MCANGPSQGDGPGTTPGAPRLNVRRNKGQEDDRVRGHGRGYNGRDEHDHG